MPTCSRQFAIFALIFALSPVPTALAEDGVVISSGRSGGGYWDAGERLAEVAKEVDLAVEVVQSDGSLDNLRRLHDPDSPVSLALAQADALQFFLRSEPDLMTQVEVLENIGQECVFIITSADSGLDSDMALQQGEGQKLAIIEGRVL